MAAMDTVHTRICTLVLPLVDVLADDYDDLPSLFAGMIRLTHVSSRVNDDSVLVRRDDPELV
jgi:hypothetical protein